MSDTKLNSVTITNCKLNNANQMFNGCTSVSTLKLEVDITKAESVFKMFASCPLDSTKCKNIVADWKISDTPCFYFFCHIW